MIEKSTEMRAFQSLYRMAGKALIFPAIHVAQTKKEELKSLKSLSPTEKPLLYIRMSKPAAIKLLPAAGFSQMTQIFPYAKSHEELRNFDKTVLAVF